MNLLRYTLFRYRLRLQEPLVLKKQRLTERIGYLVCFEDRAGRKGWGDAAPLPGFSRETSSEVETQLLSWLRDQSCWQHGVIDASELVPSACFALETAMLQLHAAQAGQSLARQLTSDAREAIAVNALIDTPGEVPAPGVTAVKVKVARDSLEEDVRRIQSIRAELGFDVTLFADANRGWAVKDALQFYEQVADCQLLYIEEPLAEPAEIPRLPFPVALDETLLELSPNQVVDWPSVVGYVLKPTLLGSLERSWAWAEQARELNLGITLSACYESGVGIWNLAHLAAAIPAGREFSGLEPYSRLGEDVLYPRLSLANYVIAVDTPMAETATVDESKLEKIADG